MKDFRGPLPLTGADFTRIRANVMAEVRSSRRPSPLWRLAFAMAFVAAFAFWQLFRVPAIEGVPPKQPKVVLTKTIAVPPLPEPASAAETPAATQPVRVVRHRGKPQRPAVEPQKPLRIEIQTSDPDIRIIWLPNMEKQS